MNYCCGDDGMGSIGCDNPPVFCREHLIQAIREAVAPYKEEVANLHKCAAELRQRIADLESSGRSERTGETS